MTEESSNPRAVKIGELLIGVGALTSGDLTEAIQIAKRMGVPIGRVLVMSGCCTESKLQQALELQSLVKDGLCDLDVGMKALTKVFREDKDLQTALKELNWAPKEDAASNKLGELLIDSNIVTRGQLDRALETSFQSGMPLGGTLVIQGVLSAQLLPTILHTQEQIRDGKMGRDQAINTLQQALMFWAKADQSKGNEDLVGGARRRSSEHTQPGGISPAVPGHTESLAVSTNNESKASEAIPVDGTSRKPALAEPGISPGAEIATRSGAQQANTATSRSPNESGSYQAVGAAITNTAQGFQTKDTEQNLVSLIELLHLSGYCTQSSLEKALTDALTDSRLAAKMLTAIGFIDSPTLNSYVYCQALIAKRVIRTDQALYILNAMRHRKITLEQALGELGIPASVLP